MLSDVCRDPLIGMYYLATLPRRRWEAARCAAAGRAPIIALYYHRVADTHANGWTISIERFKAQINWLRERFDVISLVEAQSRMGSRLNDSAAVCITFDDGYAENCDVAIPWLLEQRLPFTYFVSTHHVLQGQPFAHDLERACPLPPNTPEQLRAMAAAGVELGAHTRRHADLGPIDDEHRLHDEIAGSKRDLEGMIDRAVRYFAFPYGLRANLSQAAFRSAFQAGYWGVCSAYGGYNHPGDDPFHIHRIHADPRWSRFCNWMTADPHRRRKVERFDPGDYRLGF
ncbi:MAG TPA: polysaccharide deacetylase family protein [Lacipirellulaceae bacterium]|nr:polysaccharide deacetylase family protein [Lacipirellulaceae bacterium]